MKDQKLKIHASAGSRTRVYCLEGNYPNRWTTNALYKMDQIYNFIACNKVSTYVIKCILVSFKNIYEKFTPSWKMLQYIYWANEFFSSIWGASSNEVNHYKHFFYSTICSTKTSHLQFAIVLYIPSLRLLAIYSLLCY